MKTINEVSRKKLRYLMFSKRNGKVIDQPIVGKIKDGQVIKYFESQEGFTSWDEFSISWDIGMKGDMVAIANRQEKWFLFDSDKTEIVARPQDYWEKEAERRGINTQVLFREECKQRGITLEQFFQLFFKSTELDQSDYKH